MHEIRPLPPVPHLTQSVTLLADVPDPTAEHLLDVRVVLISGEIDDVTARRVIGRLRLLAARDARRDITLHVGSPGGSAAAALAIVDTMTLVAPDVATCAFGIVGSAGQLLVTTGAPGRRTALPHARLRMGADRPGFGAAAYRDEVVALVARCSGQDPERVAADADRWFTAAEARDYGLVDAVATQ